MKHIKYEYLRKYVKGEPRDEYMKGNLVGVSDADDGCIYGLYRWIATGNYVCDGMSKYAEEKEQASRDGGTTWDDTGLTRRGSLIEDYSDDCAGIDVGDDTWGGLRIISQFPDDNVTIVPTEEYVNGLRVFDIIDSSQGTEPISVVYVPTSLYVPYPEDLSKMCFLGIAYIVEDNNYAYNAYAYSEYPPAYIVRMEGTITTASNKISVFDRKIYTKISAGFEMPTLDSSIYIGSEKERIIEVSLKIDDTIPHMNIMSGTYSGINYEKTKMYYGYPKVLTPTLNGVEVFDNEHIPNENIKKSINSVATAPFVWYRNSFEQVLVNGATVYEGEYTDKVTCSLQEVYLDSYSGISKYEDVLRTKPGVYGIDMKTTTSTNYGGKYYKGTAEGLGYPLIFTANNRTIVRGDRVYLTPPEHSYDPFTFTDDVTVFSDYTFYKQYIYSIFIENAGNKTIGYIAPFHMTLGAFTDLGGAKYYDKVSAEIIYLHEAGDIAFSDWTVGPQYFVLDRCSQECVDKIAEKGLNYKVLNG